MYGEDFDEKPKPDYFLICACIAAISFVVWGVYSIYRDDKGREACQFVNNYTQYRASYSPATKECMGNVDGQLSSFSLNSGNLVIKKKKITVQYK